MNDDHAEDAEEDVEKCQAEEHDSHGEHGDTESVGVVSLQAGDLALVDLNIVAGSWGDGLCGLGVPLLETVLDAGIRLVGSQCRHAHGVDEVDAVTIVEGYPNGCARGNLCIQVKESLGGVGVEEKHQMLPGRHGRTVVTVRDGAHHLDALRCRE